MASTALDKGLMLALADVELFAAELAAEDVDLFAAELAVEDVVFFAGELAVEDVDLFVAELADALFVLAWLKAGIACTVTIATAKIMLVNILFMESLL